MALYKQFYPQLASYATLLKVRMKIPPVSHQRYAALVGHSMVSFLRLAHNRYATLERLLPSLNVPLYLGGSYFYEFYPQVVCS